MQIFSGLSNQKKIKKTPWNAVYISCFIVIISGFNMTMYTTSVWPYLQSLTNKADVQWLGWSLAATSLGSIVASPVLGWLQQRQNSIKPLIFAFISSLFGNLIYALLPAVDEVHLLFALLGSRILLGFTASAISVLRTYVAINSLDADRQAASCYIGLGLSVGLSMGPVVQALFLPLKSDFYQIGPILLNEFTLPAFLMTLTSLFIIIIVACFVKDHGNHVESEKNGKEETSLPYSKSGLAVLFYVWCLLMTAATSEYAIAAPLTMAMYGWNGEEVVSKHGLIQTLQCLAAASTDSIIIFSRFKKIDHRKQLMFAMFLFTMASVCLFPWPFYKTIEIPAIEHQEVIREETSCENDARVCVAKIIPLPLYVSVLAFCYGPAVAMGISTTNVLVSLVLGPRKQGFIQGLMGSGGALASFLCPIVASYFFSKDGTRTFALLNGTLYLLASLSILFAYNKLRPLKQ